MGPSIGLLTMWHMVSSRASYLRREREKESKMEASVSFTSSLRSDISSLRYPTGMQIKPGLVLEGTTEGCE